MTSVLKRDKRRYSYRDERRKLCENRGRCTNSAATSKGIPTPRTERAKKWEILKWRLQRECGLADIRPPELRE